MSMLAAWTLIAMVNRAPWAGSRFDVGASPRRPSELFDVGDQRLARSARPTSSSISVQLDVGDQRSPRRRKSSPRRRRPFVITKLPLDGGDHHKSRSIRIPAAKAKSPFGSSKERLCPLLCLRSTNWARSAPLTSWLERCQVSPAPEQAEEAAVAHPAPGRPRSRRRRRTVSTAVCPPRRKEIKAPCDNH